MTNLHEIWQDDAECIPAVHNCYNLKCPRWQMATILKIEWMGLTSALVVCHLKINFLTISAPEWPILHHCAKFCWDRSHSCKDMMIFRDCLQLFKKLSSLRFWMNFCAAIHTVKTPIMRDCHFCCKIMQVFAIKIIQNYVKIKWLLFLHHTTSVPKILLYKQILKLNNTVHWILRQSITTPTSDLLFVCDKSSNTAICV